MHRKTMQLMNRLIMSNLGVVAWSLPIRRFVVSGDDFTVDADVEAVTVVTNREVFNFDVGEDFTVGKIFIFSVIVALECVVLFVVISNVVSSFWCVGATTSTWSIVSSLSSSGATLVVNAGVTESMSVSVTTSFIWLWSVIFFWSLKHCTIWSSVKCLLKIVFIPDFCLFLVSSI